MADFSNVCNIYIISNFSFAASTERDFRDPADVVYFATAVENYLPYVTRLSDAGSVGSYMMDMIANVLDVKPTLMAR